MSHKLHIDNILYCYFRELTKHTNDSAVTGSTDSGHSSLVTYCASQVFKQSGQNTYEWRLKMLRSVILLGFTSLASLAMKEPGHTSPVTYCEPLSFGVNYESQENDSVFTEATCTFQWSSYI
ncbi:hypothetical protein K501DRAFT_277281 [Backusella circina FSU 941]|nr:hypothetical protein K501DRAFT_277281 [Backusella circina FSU 941]